MSGRVNLPGADELFRGSAQPAASDPRRPRSAGRGTSGRVRHDEKITVYVSTDELLALEQARLRVRAEFGMNVDRGRLVREAVAMLVADLTERGEESAVIQRLQQ